MTNIPLKANVACSDGPCGLSTNVIVNPINHKVTHFALRDKSLADNPTRLVPAGMVAGVTAQQITLTCSKADVEAMPPFIVTNFIPQSAPGYAYATGEAYCSQYVVNDTGYDAVNEPAIPAGEEEVHSGMHVQATDGKVGKLDALVGAPEHFDNMASHMQATSANLLRLQASAERSRRPDLRRRGSLPRRG